eukprot:symbB.v1.2.021140.t1/scaffold1812.1/size105704/4
MALRALWRGGSALNQRHGFWRSLASKTSRRKQRDLQQRLKGADGDQVLQLFQQEGCSFDKIHLLTAMRAVVLSPPMTWPLGPLLQRVSWLFLGQAKLEETMGLPAKDSGIAAMTALNMAVAQTETCATLTSSELSVVAWALAKLPQDPCEEAIKCIVRETEERAKQMTGKEAVNLAWAFSKMQVREMHLMEQLSKRVVEEFSKLNRQDTGNAAWAFAKADVSSEALMRGIREKFLRESHAFDAQEFASIIWSFAWLDAADEVLLRRFCVVAAKVARQLNCGGVARVSWAFASMAESEGPHIPQLKSSVRQLGLNSFGATELSKLTWAFAKVELEVDEPLMMDIAQQVEKRVPMLNARDVDMVAWALAKANVTMPDLMAKLAKHAVLVAPHLDAKGLANCAAAFALCRVEVVGLRSALSKRSKEEIENFSAQGLCDLRWAFATQQWLEPSLEEAISVAPGWVERPEYVHETQAGAVADCFKHLVLVALLQSLQVAVVHPHGEGDEESILYVDTHAGAGLYQLQELHKQNLQKLLCVSTRRMPASVHAYVDCLRSFEGYPGSPLLPLRLSCRAVLFEAVRSTYEELCENIKGFGGVEVFHEDAYRGLPKLLSEPQRGRPLIFIDPPYDLCFADNLNFTLVQQIQQAWPDSTVALW